MCHPCSSSSLKSNLHKFFYIDLHIANPLELIKYNREKAAKILQVYLHHIFLSVFAKVSARESKVSPQLHRLRDSKQT